MTRESDPDDRGDADSAESGLSVTALGTGASALNNGRASAGYVIRIYGEPAFLLDAGGGTAARISDAGIDLTAIDAVFLGHLHTDHTSDLPAVVKATYQQGRDRPLSIYGPTGTDERPGTDAFVSRLFDAENGVYNYLPEFVDRYAAGELELETTEIDAAIREHDAVRSVYRDGGVAVEAIPETHGRIPTLAYRITYEGSSITVTGDTTSETGNLRTLADGTDVLVHNRILETDTDSGAPKTDLHSAPEEIGANARVADAGMLVVSHVSQKSRDEIERELAIIDREYDGPIAVVRDLTTVHPDGRLTDAHREDNGIIATETR